MGALKTMAIVYESAREKLCKDVLTKLMFGNHCFTFIRIGPKQENTYTLSSGSEVAKMLALKLDAAQEIYVINPKGTIVPYLNSILSYAQESKKPVHYLYKFCYTDCAHRKGKACALSDEVYGIPHNHNLLPACENYSRIYDSLLVSTKKQSGLTAHKSPEPMISESSESTIEIQQEEAAL